MNTHEHLRDVKQDAIALWLAVASGDQDGQQALVAHTPCAGCLVLQAICLGIILIADEPFLNDAGLIQMPPAELHELESALAGMREAVNGEQS